MPSKKTSKKIRDIKGVVTRQKRYSTLAKKEGQYAKKKEKEERKHGMTEQAKDSHQEHIIADKFAVKRKRIAAKEQSKLNKLVKKTKTKKGKRK